MSAFLGPIHYWLYRKIKLVNEREDLLYNKVYEMCGEMAEETRAVIWDTFGSPPPDVDLAELIDHSNIHGWLQKQITLAEIREAALVQAITERCGQAAMDLALETFAAQAELCGAAARKQEKYIVDSAAGIYAALNDNRLNGMPCDQPDTVLENTAERVVWESGPCLQTRNWVTGGVDSALMERLYQRWLNAFCFGNESQFFLSADIANSSRR